MFIRNGKRFNIHAPFTDDEGNKYSNLHDPELQAKFGVTEIPDPHRESEETHYVQEIDEAPYVVNTPRPVEQVREILCAEVNARRDELETSGFEFRGKWFQSDQRSFNRIQGMATAANFALASQQPFDPVEWVAEDNSTMVMSAEDIVAFFGALVTHGSTVHNKAAILKRYINRSSFEELVQFNLDEQWPLER